MTVMVLPAFVSSNAAFAKLSLVDAVKVPTSEPVPVSGMLTVMALSYLGVVRSLS